MGKFSEASRRTPKTSSKGFSNDDVYVSKSGYLDTCNAKGYGLYANRSFLKGDVIQEYRGKRISKQQSDKKLNNTQYMFAVKKKKNDRICD